MSESLPDCAECHHTIPAQRRALKDRIAALFCTDKCAVAHASTFIYATRQAELKAGAEIQDELGPDWKRIMTEQFVKAAEESGDPRRVLPLFVAKVTGHLAPVLAEKFMTKLLNGIREKLGKKKAGKPKKPAAPESSDDSFGASKPPPGKPHPAPSMPNEPPNLDELPLEAQRLWLIRRFKKLKPDSTVDEIKAERSRLVKALHPDRAQNNPKKEAVLSQLLASLNATFARLKEIDDELGRPWP